MVKDMYELSWGSDYPQTKNKIVTRKYFTQKRGFSKTDIKTIKTMRKGGVWIEPTPFGGGLRIKKYKR